MNGDLPVAYVRFVDPVSGDLLVAALALVEQFPDGDVWMRVVAFDPECEPKG